MGNVSEKKLEKRLRLLKSARELFEKQGIAPTAIDDVVKAAGVAKGTFYLYFKDKYDLVDQLLINDIRGLLHETIASTELSGYTPSQAMLWFFEQFLEYLKTHKALATLAQKNINACFVGLADSSDEETVNDIGLLIAPLEKAGLSRAEIRLDFYFLADMLASACCDAIIGVSPFSLEETADKAKALIRSMCADTVDA